MSSTLRGIVDWLAREMAAAKGSEATNESLRIAQRISAALQRENARVVLKRLVLWEEEKDVPSPWAEREPEMRFQ